MTASRHARRARRSLIVVAVLAALAGPVTLTLSATSRAQVGHGARRATGQDPTASPATETVVSATQAATSTEVLATHVPTATATLLPSPTAAATATPVPLPVRRHYYLPAVLRHHPPLPYKPVLRPIDNDEEDGDYTVEWGESLLARRYELQEDDDPAFGSPTVVYDGSEYRYGWAVTGHAFGTYHYRVRGVNDTGAGAWSDVVRTRAWPPRVFGAAADADMSDKFTTIATGTDISMWVGYHTKGCLDVNATVGVVRSLVRFDLGAVPPGTPFDRAVLNLTTVAGCWSSDIDGQWRDVTAFRLDKPWDEGAVNWKNRPKEGEAVGTARVHAADDIIGPLTIDITAIARRWVDGAAPNHGLLLRAPENSSRNAFLVAVFGTREWESIAERPYVTITYESEDAALAGAPPGAREHGPVVDHDDGAAPRGGCVERAGVVRCGAAMTERDVDGR